MAMASFILGSVAFGYTFYAINPTAIVDCMIRAAVDTVVPGGGIGESNWFMKNWRSIEQSTRKTSRELEIRADLRRWDQQHPELHHELIVRYLAGIIASALVTAVYDVFRPPVSRPSRRY